METPRRPGRPPRADARATHRAEIRMTLSELRAVQALARANQCSIADLIRLTLLDAAAEAGDDAPVRLSQAMLDRHRAIVAGNNTAGMRQQNVDGADTPRSTSLKT